MLWGIVGFFIMIAVFAIMQIILKTFGITNVKIQSNGDYQVGDLGLKTSGPTYDLNNGGLSTTEVVGGFKDGIDQSSAVADLTNPTKNTPTATTNYTVNPFKYNYQSNKLCWAKAMYVKDTTEYKALQSLKNGSFQLVYADTKLKEYAPQSNPDDNRYPTVVESQTMYDKASKLYYVWWGVTAPIGKDADGKLTSIDPKTNVDGCKMLLKPTNESTKLTSLVNKYPSNAKFDVVVGSGVASSMTLARTTALNNAVIKMAALKGYNDIAQVKYEIIPDEKYFGPDPNGIFDYFIAIQSPK
jgi:hypothetical protein